MLTSSDVSHHAHWRKPLFHFPEFSIDTFVFRTKQMIKKKLTSDRFSGEDEVGWWKRVGDMFAGMYRLELRHLVIEVLMATALILERNPEVSFLTRTDVDEVVRAAVDSFKKVSR